MRPDLYYCADGNKRFADIAIAHGFRYGPRRLKCTVDNSANEFYARTMTLVGQEPGRKRPLNVWVS